MNAICDTTAKSETLSVKGCKVKITYAPADTDCLDAIQKLLQTTILRTAGAHRRLTSLYSLTA